MTKPLLKGWKVLRYGRMSCTNYGQVVRYKKRRKTYRPFNCGPLAVFIEEFDAINFIRRTNFHGLKHIPCLYKPSRDRNLWKMASTTHCYPTVRIPNGTDFADHVTCLE